MSCYFCGGGDRWIKTCLTSDSSRIRACDPCWEARTSELVIVPGDEVVTARCNQCRGYFNPREMAQLSPGGRKAGFSGTCRMCTKKLPREHTDEGIPA